MPLKETTAENKKDALIAQLLEALQDLDKAHNHETLCRAKEKSRAAISKATQAMSTGLHY